MRRYFESLRPADRSAINSVPDGLFLVRVDRSEVPMARKQTLLLDPLRSSRAQTFGRVLDHWPALYAKSRRNQLSFHIALAVQYDAELLNKDEIEDKALVGLQGIVKISHAIVHGLSLLNLDGFASRSPLGRTLTLDNYGRPTWI